jgi:hypothetical protein
MRIYVCGGKVGEIIVISATLLPLLVGKVGEIIVISTTLLPLLVGMTFKCLLNHIDAPLNIFNVFLHAECTQ